MALGGMSGACQEATVLRVENAEGLNSTVN